MSPLIRRVAKTWLTIELKKRREKVKGETGSWNGAQGSELAQAAIRE